MMAPLAPDLRVPQDLLEVRNMLASRAENWKQQWLQEGRREGRQEGILKGESALLIRLLERRFGALPGWARDRIASADIADLEEWSLRVLDAASLDEVFR
jgi:predicted transposase YdaD